MKIDKWYSFFESDQRDDWKYAIKIAEPLTSDIRQELNKIDEWCDVHFGKREITWSPRIGGWYFKNKADMVFFVMTWG